MSNLIRLLNPAAPITTEAEAIAAGRASAIAIFLGVVWGGVGIVYMMTAGQAIVDAALAEATADAPEMAGMAGLMAQGVLWVMIAFIGIQLVLGLVQWAKPNIVIPIIFAILVAWGLLSNLAGLLGMGQAAGAAATPGWQTWLGLAVLIVQLVMHIAGIRGARKLDQIRMQAAQ